jgi:predicted transcriptional regulator
MRRSKLEIIVNLLEVCEEDALKTTLVYKTNLNFKLITKYLALLLENEWVLENRGTYRITGKGECFLRKARDVLSEL